MGDQDASRDALEKQIAGLQIALEKLAEMPGHNEPGQLVNAQIEQATEKLRILEGALAAMGPDDNRTAASQS